MKYDDAKIEDAVLALLALYSFDSGRSWKGFDFGVMDRLSEQGYISEPKGEAKSVHVTEDGLKRGLEIAKPLFGNNLENEINRPKNLNQQCRKCQSAIWPLFTAQRSNYAINPTPEQALRSNRAVLPARVIAALGLQSGLAVSFSLGGDRMNLTFEVERETGGRWIAEVPELPGVLAYGCSASEAMARAEVLALRVVAERIEHGEALPMPLQVVLPTAA